MTPDFTFNPAVPTPPRRKRSIRRTTTHDSNRPQGLDGPVAHVATGRELVTDSAGQTHVTDAARITAEVDYNRVMILSIACDPPEPAMSGLIGKGAYSGFRKTVEAMLPGEFSSHRLRGQLLDDLPPAVMGNGRALRAEGMRIGVSRPKTLPVGICAGWADGGTLVSGYSELGPPLLIGPAASSLEDADDTLAWHEFGPLAPHGTRRARRLDIWEEDGEGWLDCFFRDSHLDRSGMESVVHEWHLRAQFDIGERRFLTACAVPGPLPYPECPASGASADRLAGMPLDGLRKAVRQDFVGTSTCTHLNDSFRALEDAGYLLDCLVGSA